MKPSLEFEHGSALLVWSTGAPGLTAEWLDAVSGTLQKHQGPLVEMQANSRNHSAVISLSAGRAGSFQGLTVPLAADHRQQRSTSNVATTPALANLDGTGRAHQSASRRERANRESGTLVGHATGNQVPEWPDKGRNRVAARQRQPHATRFVAWEHSSAVFTSNTAIEQNCAAPDGQRIQRTAETERAASGNSERVAKQDSNRNALRKHRCTYSAEDSHGASPCRAHQFNMLTDPTTYWIMAFACAVCAVGVWIMRNIK